MKRMRCSFFSLKRPFTNLPVDSLNGTMAIPFQSQSNNVVQMWKNCNAACLLSSHGSYSKQGFCEYFISSSMMVKRICNQLPTTIIGANNSLFATALNGQNERLNRKALSDRYNWNMLRCIFKLCHNSNFPLQKYAWNKLNLCRA